MNKLVMMSLVGALAASVAACQQDNRNIERKLDQILDRLNHMPAAGAPGAAAGAPQQRRREPDRNKVYAVSVDGDPTEGPADALVTLVKAYDYACPYCERVRPKMAALRQKYGNELRIVYKQLVVHPRNAMASALAFCAAAKQGRGFEMDRLLWDKGFKQRQMDLSDVPAAEGGQPQKCWDTAAGCSHVVGFAQELGLDVERFKTDMKGTCEAQVQKDMKELRSLAVGATPSFFINGRFTSGDMPIERFERLVDEELKKAKEAVQRGTPAAQYYQQMVLAKGQKSV